MMILAEKKTCEDVEQLAKHLEQLDDTGRIAVNAFILGYNGGFSAGSVASTGDSEEER